MMDCASLSRQAILEGERIREAVGVKAASPISIYDVASKLGIVVRFINVPSLEGVYSRGPQPLIVLGSDRPIGRQAFNCAHELGHHVFGHSQAVDEIDSMGSERNRKSPDEFIADGFAAHILMPQFTVIKAFRSRGIKIQAAEPMQVYRIANYLEVGYRTLVNHLAYGCRILPREKALELLKTEPKSIRQGLLGKPSDTELVVVDDFWTDRAVDIRVDDHILAPFETTFDGIGLQLVGENDNGMVFQGVRQSSTSRLLNEKTGWAQFVRVMPRKYVGLSEYRHMKEEEDGD